MLMTIAVPGRWVSIHHRASVAASQLFADAPRSPAELLEGDLTVPGYKPATGGFYVIEEKDEIAKRLGRSPDVGDAVAMAMWHNPSSGKGEDPAEPNRPRESGRRRPHAIRYADAAFG